MARMDIYSRIEEMVEEMRGDWKMFFQSEELNEFAHRYLTNLFAGVYESLRVEGAQISPDLVETEMQKFIFERLYDPNSEVETAYCTSTDKQFKICVNGAGAIISKVKTVDEKFEVFVGHLIHEAGHRLFTDFLTNAAQCVQMARFGRWFPRAPEAVNTADGINLQQKLMNNENYRQTVAKIMSALQNFLEDGYVEEEMRSHYPGLASSYLGYKNEVMFAETPSLTDIANEPDVSHLEMVMNQWLMYAKYFKLKTGEKDIADFDPVITDPIWRAMDIIDEARIQRDPLARADAVNQLVVMISPLLDEEIAKQEKKQQQSQQNQQGQQGQQNQQGQQGGNAAVNQTIQNTISNLVQALGNPGTSTGNTPAGGAANKAQGGSNSGNQNSSKSITDPNRVQNSGLKKTVSNGNGSNGETASDGQGNGGSANGPAGIDHSAAKHDLENLLTEAAFAKYKQEAEKERTKEMQREANEMDSSEFPGAKPNISRAESVSEANKAAYKKFAGRSAQIAKRLAMILQKRLKSEETEEYMPWQYSGRKFVAKQYCRDNLKGFAKKSLPSEKLKCRVYVLVDESGSVSGELSEAEIETCIVLEQFCADMDVPLTIQGYTSSGGSLDIISYVEEKKIDGDDKYRLTGMSARGGTPTVGAMTYATNRLKKMPDKVKTLLFVITDGSAGDDDEKGTRTRKLVEKAAKDGIQTIACGIGRNQRQVENEFGDDNYLGISNLEEMPERLVEIIRRRIMRK